jgi:hypothetical protein
VTEKEVYAEVHVTINLTASRRRRHAPIRAKERPHAQREALSCALSRGQTNTAELEALAAVTSSSDDACVGLDLTPRQAL